MGLIDTMDDEANSTDSPLSENVTEPLIMVTMEPDDGNENGTTVDIDDDNVTETPNVRQSSSAPSTSVQTTDVIVDDSTTEEETTTTTMQAPTTTAQATMKTSRGPTTMPSRIPSTTPSKMPSTTTTPRMGGLGQSTDAGLSGGAIAGIVLGVLVVAIVAVAGVWLYYRRKNKRGPKRRDFQSDDNPKEFQLSKSVTSSKTSHEAPSQMAPSFQDFAKADTTIASETGIVNLGAETTDSHDNIKPDQVSIPETDSDDDDDDKKKGAVNKGGDDDEDTRSVGFVKLSESADTDADADEEKKTSTFASGNDTKASTTDEVKASTSNETKAPNLDGDADADDKVSTSASDDGTKKATLTADAEADVTAPTADVDATKANEESTLNSNTYETLNANADANGDTSTSNDYTNLAV